MPEFRKRCRTLLLTSQSEYTLISAGNNNIPFQTTLAQKSCTRIESYVDQAMNRFGRC